MAYDPNLPANNSPIVSAELRSQFAGLKALIDGLQATISAQQTQIDAQQVQINGMPAQLGGAKNIDDFVLSMDDISNPPQKVEVEDIQGQLSDLVQALKH